MNSTSPVLTRVRRWLKRSLARWLGMNAQPQGFGEVVKLQQALQGAQDQLHQVQAQAQAQSQHLNVLMHELKNPLSVVTMALETGTSKPEHLDLALRAAREMHDLLDRTLWVDRLAGGRVRIQQHSFDWVEVINEALSPGVANAEANFTTEMPAALSCRSDVTMVRMVVRNLIENARKYADPRQAIRLVLRADEATRRVTFSITNRAGDAGVPDAERVFDKYYRSAQAASIPGSGLGLHLSLALAHALGGELSMTAQGSHVTFTFSVPCAHTPAVTGTEGAPRVS